MYTYSFEKLEVWIDAKEFAKLIYTLTTTFPGSEKYGLISQLRRAAISVCSNIAEGSARNSYKDKAHFTTMAYGSMTEVLNQLILAYELNFITQSDYFKLRQDIEGITNKLNALRNFQVSKSSNETKG